MECVVHLILQLIQLLLQFFHFPDTSSHLNPLNILCTSSKILKPRFVLSRSFLLLWFRYDAFTKIVPFCESFMVYDLTTGKQLRYYRFLTYSNLSIGGSDINDLTVGSFHLIAYFVLLILYV